MLVDPSHGTGHTPLVAAPMAAAAIAAGADGLIVEVHPDPETALSDGYQSLDLVPQFEELMALCRRVAAAVGRTIAECRPNCGGRRAVDCRGTNLKTSR